MRRPKILCAVRTGAHASPPQDGWCAAAGGGGVVAVDTGGGGVRWRLPAGEANQQTSISRTVLNLK